MLRSNTGISSSTAKDWSTSRQGSEPVIITKCPVS